MIQSFNSFNSFKQILEEGKLLEVEFSIEEFKKQNALVNSSQRQIKKDEYINKFITMTNNFSLTDDDLPLSLNFDKSSFHSVLRIVYPRLAYGLLLVKNNYVKRKLFDQYIEFIELIRYNLNENDIELHVAILLNSSRGLIDNAKAAENSMDFLMETPLYVLNEDENKIFKKNRSYIEDILTTKTAKNAIKMTCLNLKHKEWEKFHQIFMTLLDKIVFVKNAKFWGMTGFNKIYFDRFYSSQVSWIIFS